MLGLKQQTIMALTASATVINHIVSYFAIVAVEAIIIVAVVVAVLTIGSAANSVVPIDFVIVVIDTTGFKNHRLILNQSLLD